MAETLTKLVVDFSKPKGDILREQYLPLTDEELALHEQDAAAAVAAEAKIEAEEQAKADSRASARVKLEALGLTAEEIAAIIG